MPDTVKQAVIDTLTDPRLVRLHFGYGATKVYPSGYHDIARMVDDGHIQFRLTNGNAAFEPDHDRGETHYLWLHTSMAEPDRGGTLRVRGAWSAFQKGTIVHEATHALQDYQRLSDPDRLGVRMTPQLAEGSAYVAAWMARLIWGMARISDDVDPLVSSHAYARMLAGRLLDHELVYLVPQRDVAQLNSMVLTGADHRYDFRGI